MHTMDAARQVVRELFASYWQQPERMKPRYAQRALQAGDDAARARAVADFVAGMTDRYAAKEHERLTGQRLLD
jgi:dGTPase